MAEPIETSVDPAGEVVDLCRELIRIDTSNYGDGTGPGERKAAEYVAALLDEVGIESKLHEPFPGRTSVIAHWGGTGRTDGLLVHGHLDVVPAEASDWRFDPFAAEVHDGYVWGRGAVDMKDFDAMVLSVVRARQRAGRVPERRGGGRAPGLRADRQGPSRPPRGRHRGRRRGRRLQHDRARPPDVP